MRKWIKNVAALRMAHPKAKILQRIRAPTPELARVIDAPSDTETYCSDIECSSTPRISHTSSSASIASERPVSPVIKADTRTEDLRAAEELLSLFGS